MLFRISVYPNILMGKLFLKTEQAPTAAYTFRIYPTIFSCDLVTPPIRDSNF